MDKEFQSPEKSSNGNVYIDFLECDDMSTGMYGY